MNNHHRPKILIVDDEPLNIQLLEAYLMRDYDILTAFNGAEALDIISEKIPDIVLLDVMMPGMDGYEVCRRIKSSDETNFIPVIIVTSLYSKKDMITGIEAGADDFLSKPVDATEVSLRVRNLIRNKQLHDDLLAESERTKKYLDIAGNIIVVLDRDHRIVLANANCCDTLGYKEDELIGSDWFEVAICPEEGDIVRSVFNNILSGEGEQVTYFENNVLTRDGSIRSISWNNSYLRDHSGKIMQVISSGNDITDKITAQEKLKESEEKFRLIAGNTSDVIWTMDKEGNFLYVSPSVQKLRGYSPEEVCAQKMSEIFPPTSLLKISERMRVFFEDMGKGSLNDRKELFEIEQYHRDGHTVWTEAIANPVFDEDGEFKFFLGVTRDMSERKKAEESIKQYTDELSKANESLEILDRMKDEFISNLSHELKTPLISIKGYSELVHDEVLGPLNEKQRNAMRIVLEKYDHLSFLLDSLIYLSIVKSGKVNYRFDPIQVEDSLRKVSEYFSFKAGERGISIKREVEHDLPLTLGDVEYIPYVFRSLLDNAIKFSPDGGSILIRIFNDDGNVHVSIKDEGIGIPENEMSMIFERFYQIDGSSARKYGGTGLGLYVSKSIVEIHGGCIWVESEEGRGTTVHVTFPVYVSKQC